MHLLGFYGSNADGNLISFVLNFLGDTLHVMCFVYENGGRPWDQTAVFWGKRDVCWFLKNSKKKALRPVKYVVEKVSVVKYLVERYLDLRLAFYI